MFGLVPFSRRHGNLAKRNDFFGIDRFFEDFFADPFFTRWNTALRADIRETEKNGLLTQNFPE